MRRCSIYFLLIVVSPLCATRTALGFSGRRAGGGASYPRSGGYSGNSNPVHTYPHSTGLSGNTRGTQRSASYGHKTEVHNHYHYNPPPHVNYGSGQYPVYRGTPPVYVYEYRNSGSRFDSLLTGLALYNLGRMSSNNNYNSYGRDQEYRSHPREICKLRINKSNGEYEETKIDCNLMSSFIWDEIRVGPSEPKTSSKTVTTLKITQNTSSESSGNSSTTTVQNTTVVDALEVKGPSLEVSPEMECFLIRMDRDIHVLKKKVKCGLLQQYARSSMMYSSGSNRLLPVSVIGLIICVSLRS